jgi:spermidine/putrescine transport system substrate-binding protein
VKNCSTSCSTRILLGDKIPKLPAFDPTGTLSGLTFANPGYWNGNEAEWSKEFGRVQRGY